MKKTAPSTANFSLLYPPGSGPQPDGYRWGDNATADLGLDEIILALSINPHYREVTKTTLLNLCADQDEIAYRQEVLADFLGSEEFAEGMREMLPRLARLHDSIMLPSTTRNLSLQETLGRLTELNAYVACVGELQAILTAAGAKLRSRGLCGLRDLLAEIVAEETYQSLAQKLPELLSRLNGVPSITLGVNLDRELRPVEVTLLSINDKRFKGGSLLQQLLGKKTSAQPDEGIAALYSVPFLQVGNIPSNRRADPMLIPIFQDLYKIIRLVIEPITRALKQYAQVNTHLLVALEAELAFYLGAVRLIRNVQAAGLPMCRAEILPKPERAGEMREMYNLLLALKLRDANENLAGAVVTNGVDFGADGRIFILTGPNHGGKTVYTQAVGVAQVLFQAGLYVPAKSARLSPVDGIYTHFASEEKTNQGMGRLSDESMRLGEIFKRLTPHSLVLLNESLSSTSATESLHLAQDIVRALRLFGARAIFATHLHELAEAAGAINNEVAGDSLVASLVAGIEQPNGHDGEASDLVPRTYKIKPGPPTGLSYARGIAVRYGISFEQLTGIWRERQQGKQARPKK